MCRTERSLVLWRVEGISGSVCGRLGLERWGEKFMEIFLARSAGGARRCEQSVNVPELQIPAQGNWDILKLIF